jgi:hypothetical protein
VTRSKNKARKKRAPSGSHERALGISKAPGPHGAGEGVRQSRKAILVSVLLAAALVLAGGLAYQTWTDGAQQHDVAGETAATFVGSETCAGCHRTQSTLWHDSQHSHAMAHATETSVLGDFSDVAFDYYGVRSRFFRKDGKFLVETDDANGKLATFEIKYTFGLDPLQQYLIEFPDGRLQALSIAWDSRPKQAGGQRWFHLYPNEEIRHDDVLCARTTIRRRITLPPRSLRSASAAKPATVRARGTSVGRGTGRAGGHLAGLTIPRRASSSNSTSAAASLGRSI